MIKAVLIFAVILLAISGLCELIHSIRLAFLTPDRDYKTIAVVWLRKGKAASQLRFVCEQSRWLGDRFARHIVAVESGVDGDEREECRKIARKNDVIMCPDQILERVIKTISE